MLQFQFCILEIFSKMPNLKSKTVFEEIMKQRSKSSTSSTSSVSRWALQVHWSGFAKINVNIRTKCSKMSPVSESIDKHYYIHILLLICDVLLIFYIHISCSVHRAQ